MNNELNKKLAEWEYAGGNKLLQADRQRQKRKTDVTDPLLEKLAKWAGLEGLVYKVGVWHLWWYFDNNGREERLPIFPESLDACFKWLVPKVARKLADIDLSTDREAMYKLFSLWIEEFWLPREQPISLALALCLAIEKLIGEK